MTSYRRHITQWCSVCCIKTQSNVKITNKNNALSKKKKQPIIQKKSNNAPTNPISKLIKQVDTDSSDSDIVIVDKNDPYAFNTNVKNKININSLKLNDPISNQDFVKKDINLVCKDKKSGQLLRKSNETSDDDIDLTKNLKKSKKKKKKKKKMYSKRKLDKLMTSTAY